MRRRADAAIAFSTTVLGATERMRLSGPDGTIGHAELGIGHRVIMLSAEFVDMGIEGPKTIGGRPVTVSVYVEEMERRAAAAQ